MCRIFTLKLYGENRAKHLEIYYVHGLGNSMLLRCQFFSNASIVSTPLQQAFLIGSFFFFNFSSCIGIYLIKKQCCDNLDKQQRDSGIYLYPFSPKLPYHSDYHKTLSRVPVGPCWLLILNIAVCTCLSQTS